MKLTLTTIYENVDQQWLRWYTDRLISSGDDNLAIVGQSLLEGKDCGFLTKDPTSEVTGSTRYCLE